MNRQPLLLWIALLLTLVSLFTGLNTLELRAEEPRRAVIALEMLLTDEWIVPQLHGWPYYNKPPLFNWLLAGAFSLLGSAAEWVVRLPSLLAFVLTALINFFAVRRYINQEVAIFSSLFYLTAADILYYGAVNAGELDLFFTLLVYLQVLSIFIFQQRQQWIGLFTVSYFFTALGFLTKGLPSLAFQIFTLLAVCGYYRAWKRLLSWQHLCGVLIFLAITGFYFYVYDQRGDAVLFLKNLVKEASQKSASESGLLPILLHLLKFPINLLKLTLPWVLFGYYLFRKDRWRILHSNALVLLSTLFILSNIWLYWISPGNRNPYLYPFFPFLFIVLAYVWQQCSKIPAVRLLQVVIAMALLRLAYSFFVMPIQSNYYFYRPITARMLAAADGKPIHFAGTWDTVVANPSIAGVALYEDTLLVPPLIPYQIPYYLTKAQGEISRFEPEPKPEQLYLIYLNAVSTERMEVLLEFDSTVVNPALALVRFK